MRKRDRQQYSVTRAKFIGCTMGVAAALAAFTAGCFVALATPAFAEPNAVGHEDCKRRAPPKIGMTAEELLASCWGTPKGIFKTTKVTGTVDTFSITDSQRE